MKGTGRTRNHRPTKKRKTRCYGHKDNQKYAKHVKNNACKRISIDREVARQVLSIIDVDRCRYRGGVEEHNIRYQIRISIDPVGVKKLSRRQKHSRSIHQVSRSCQDCDKKSWRSSTESKVSKRYRGGVEQAFKTNFIFQKQVKTV